MKTLHIDLRHLAAAANARMIVATVTGIDADLKQIYFDDRPALRFDVLSINIGGQHSLAMIDGPPNTPSQSNRFQSFKPI